MQARVDGEAREQAGVALHTLRADLSAAAKEAAKEESEQAQREVRAARARETEMARSLESKMDGIVAETQGAFNTLGGQLRDLSEVDRYTYIHTHTHTYMYVYYICMYMISVYIYIYIHAYIYIYIYRSLESKLDGIVAETQGAFTTLGGRVNP